MTVAYRLTVEEYNKQADERAAFIRRKLPKVASRIIDALRATPAVQQVPVDEGLRRGISNTIPSEMPVIEYDTGSEVWDKNSKGNAPVTLRMTETPGNFYRLEFKDEQYYLGSFDTGFYVGVLAVKEGLVDPQQFHYMPDISDEELEVRQDND
ncbi:MAG TPA: hypothetical protein VLG13_00890 [Patescibacteria group bacterium]|nr:hypothetical protein [Patescibacteria group bacterium]